MRLFRLVLVLAAANYAVMHAAPGPHSWNPGTVAPLLNAGGPVNLVPRSWGPTIPLRWWPSTR